MIPSIAQLRDAFAFFARRHGLDAAVNEAAVTSALEELADLSPRAEDEPAAAFYAFARHPRAFPGAATAFTVLLAQSVAAARGLAIDAPAAELRRLFFDVAERRLDYDELRAWFEPRLRR